MLYRVLFKPSIIGFAFSLMLSSCAVVTVVDAAATVVATGVKVVAKTVGAAVDAVLPDSEDNDSK